MCGITGLFGRNHDGGLDKQVKQMTVSLSHRGPDDSGFWVNENRTIALGHRRLSVLELSKAGHQPMESACGRFVMTFNGEIYNHLELRKELLDPKKMTHWKGNSDTETILEGFSKWGVNLTIEKMVGMFALAVWDKSEERLYLARDRVGEKPLYFGWSNGNFVFGSELKAIKNYAGFNNEIDRDALCLFLRHTYIPSPRSIYKGIYKLQPGHILKIKLKDTLSAPDIGFFSNSLNLKEYWSFKNTIEEGQANLITDELEAVELLEKSLRESIKIQSIADVPLGAFLSGGIDSSLIVSLMQSESLSPVHTYSIGFKESGYDEAIYAKEVAKHLGTEHTELYVSAEDALSVVPSLSTLYDEPFADSSQIPTYLVSKMARKHVTVALSGDAGDELFGGYNRHIRGPSLWKLISCVPYYLRPAFSEAIKLLPALFLNKIGNNLPGSYKTSFLGHKMHRFADRLGSVKEDNDLYFSLISEWEDPEKVVLNSREPKSLLKDKSLWPKLNSFEETMMYLDTMTYLPDDILAKVDRAAMGVSLETRVPFLDHRVVELSARIPLEHKIKKGKGKQILRKILDKHVPQHLIERPKQGFGIPLEDWLRGPLRDWSEDLMNESKLKREGFFNPSVIRTRWKEHLLEKRNWEHSLWSILMFQSWLDSQ